MSPFTVFLNTPRATRREISPLSFISWRDEPPDRHVADCLRLQEPQGERCRWLPSSTRVTDTKDADFLHRQEPRRDTAFR
ncbi:hypothetical protein DY000_02059532 [Brassica cretica]|uniref:Uncharacterized protein n=1 Tax=Brassica cretica TaxID=69181 RepID=A0ABQ7ANQ5_BRACR|nr:hypothetical protein DY000_02059532 [Brassica cretica]